MDPIALDPSAVLAECQAIDPRLVELAANRVANRILAARVAELEAAPALGRSAHELETDTEPQHDRE